jgi:radical SAM superfamily enzyme YgiQ (UPF0313 family)
MSFSPAFLSLSAYLKSKMDVSVKLLHLNEQHGIPYDLSLICAETLAFSPDLIGFTCTTYSYHYVNEISGTLKDTGVRAPIVLGGCHATIQPEDLETSNVDAFCTGEGELSLLELCRRIEAKEDITATPGFNFKTKDGILKNPPGAVLTDLNDLPFLDFDLMDTAKMLKLRSGWMNISFSRGCPYACTFCINQILSAHHRSISKDSYFRRQTPERIAQELEHWLGHYAGQIKVFNFDDDLLMLKKDWFLRFTELYEQKIFKPYGVKYIINARANLVDADIIRALKTSGCHEIQVGFETGDEDLRNGILQKQVTDEHLLNTFGLCRELGVRTLAYTMLGIPGESKQTIEKTLDMLNKLKPTLIRMTIFDPFMGTPLYDYCAEHKLFKSDIQAEANHFTASRLVFEDLSDRDILLYHLLCPWYLNTVGNMDTHGQYSRLIEQFGAYSFSDLLVPGTRQQIIEADKSASDAMINLKTAHFRYFPGNSFYYEYKESV